MRKRLIIQAIVKFLSGVIITAVLLFASAGTVSYPNVWLFITVLFIPMLLLGIVMAVKFPKFLEKRLNSRERDSEQKNVIVMGGLMFIVGFVLAGLDFRYKITYIPKGAVITASIIFLTAYILYIEVMRENAYLSRTIEIQENQRVVDTGLYGIVRHPMYGVTIFMFLSIPIILGSIISFLIFLLYPFLIVKRIKNEELFLEKELEGYREYKQKVRYKIIPFIW